MAAHSHQNGGPAEQETLLADDLHNDEIFEEKAVPQPQAARGKRSTAFLDGLRGVAALCVFCGHMMGGGDQERGFGDPDGFNYLMSFPFIRVLYTGGPAAVAVFFVLSGFVVTQTMVKLVNNDQPQGFLKTWGSSMVRRPIRLYLPCWGVAFIIAMALHLPFDLYPAVPWLEASSSIWVEIARWATQCWQYFWPFKHHASDQAWFIYDLVCWTIPIELKGSFLCYGLVGLYALAIKNFGRDSPVHYWAVGVCMATAAFLLQLGHWWPACFLAGYSWSILEVRGLDKPLLNRTFTLDLGQRRVTVPATTIALNVILFWSWYLLSAPATSGKPEWSLATPGWYWLTKMIPKFYNQDQFYRYWTSWGGIGIVYATLRTPWLQWFFNTRPLQYLGKTSFMLYLVHLPLAYCFSDRWFRIFGHIPAFSESKWWDNMLWLPEWGVKGFNVRWLVACGSVLAVNLAVSEFLTRLLDQPSVKLGKYVSGKLGLNNPPKRTPLLGEPA